MDLQFKYINVYWKLLEYFSMFSDIYIWETSKATKSIKWENNFSFRKRFFEKVPELLDI